MRIEDAEFRILASISQALQVDDASEDSRWEGSPFRWIKSRSSRQRGAIGEKLVSGWLAARSFNVSRSTDSEADRVIEHKRVEIKFSTLWRNGRYKFQQLRDQNYDLAICLGVSPFTAHCWVIPKEDILRMWRVDGLIHGQHGGAAGADTAWIDVPVDAIPPWLSEYGGSLSEGLSILSEITGFAVNEVFE